MSFFPDIQLLIREIQEFKNTQAKNQAQIIDLLKEQNQLLKELTKNDGKNFRKE